MDAKKMSETIKAKRLTKKVTLAEVAKAVGKNPTYVAAALAGNHRLTADEAKKAGKLLGLDAETTNALTKFPVRTDFPITTDPFKYRLLEIIGARGCCRRGRAPSRPRRCHRASARPGCPRSRRRWPSRRR